MTCRPSIAALVVLVLAGCGDDDGAGPTDAGMEAGIDAGPPDGGWIAPATARFALAATGALSWGDVPYPSDLYLDEGGHPDLADLPPSRVDEPFRGRLLDLLATRDGFCATCNTFFLIDGPLDPASMPEDRGPTEAGAASDPIVLLDADDTSPDVGRLLPLRVEHDVAASRIAVRLARGHALHQQRRYVAAITDALRATDGSALAPSPLFAALRDGTAAPAGVDAAALERARPSVTAALDALASAGIAREHVVALAAFTTQHVTADLETASDLVEAAPAPAAVLDHVWPSADVSLDDLLGVPGEDRPGNDTPPMAGTEGTRAFLHGSFAFVVAGHFASPRVVEGAGVEIGVSRRDASGALTTGPIPEQVSFLLVVPDVPDISRLPVLVVQHGLSGTRLDAFLVGETAAKVGIAVLAVDGFQHGTRAASSRDLINEMRGLDGPDGIAEHAVGDVQARAFGLAGTPEGLELFPAYPLATFTQLVTDIHSATRFVAEGDLAELRAADPALATLGFDPDRVMYLGQSMGSVVGAGVLASNSRVQAMVLNVPPGSVVETMAEGVGFRGFAETVLLPYLGVTGSFDEVTRHLLHDPMLDIYRWILEPIDPLALAPTFFASPVRDAPSPPDVLWQLGDLDELAAPPATESMLYAAGVPGAITGPSSFGFAPLAPAPASPIRENLITPTGTVTAAAWLWAPGTHAILANLTHESTVEPPMIPPFHVRRPRLPVMHPIQAIHDQITTFLREEVATGHGVIEAP